MKFKLERKLNMAAEKLLKPVPNFTLVPFPESCVNVYGSDCMGCKATKSDVMLTFGSTIAPMDSNNQIHPKINPEHVDVFLTKNQALQLLNSLKKVLNEK